MLTVLIVAPGRTPLLEDPPILQEIVVDLQDVLPVALEVLAEPEALVAVVLLLLLPEAAGEDSLKFKKQTIEITLQPNL